MTIFEDLGNYLISALVGAFTVCESSRPHLPFFTSWGVESAMLAQSGEIQPLIINRL